MESKLLEASKIYNGKTIAIHNYIELKKLEHYDKENYILFFGRLSDEKGLRIFLEVCKELKNIKFKVAGTGPLQSLCGNFSSNVEYVGFKTGKDLEQLISKAKFSVYPSIWYENCPLSILESESLGTPVITANYGGMKELVDDGETGILINKIDKDSLKNAIMSLYNDDKKINEMSKKCIEKREKMISMDQYCKKLEEIYNQVLKEVKYENSNDRT